LRAPDIRGTAIPIERREPDPAAVAGLDLSRIAAFGQTGPMTTDPITGASWSELMAAQPNIAETGQRLLDRANGAALLATVRGADSPPRLHPVTVGVVDGALYAFLLDSAKRRDLVDDGRYALHAHQDRTAPDEFSVRGRARLVPAGDVRNRVGSGWFFTVDDTYWLFELRIEAAILGERAEDEWPPRYTRWSAPRA
jgi:hypothetical protein